ncbi:hypothetical protein SAMN05216223_119166 [Actinacidiphila yanglinensis]|uniref:Uncharacterized protein n=1 Tax=Actinacidiphila yanglinensis TaxID=310779 RepID=A0A1H6DUC6_9ACTN|nr:hypothetical protein [Actinacidiphila yanglinensis]SEG88891.1 hypothetical protein SAMN05216223_119166 [Actinacidiphila yanglinensis]
MSLGQDGPPTRTRMPEGHGAHGPAGRRPQPRRALMTVVGVVVILVAALAFATRGGGSSSSDDAGSGGSSGGGSAAKGSASTTAPTGERPVTGKSAGIPAGFAHTAQGAQSAAANYAVALGGVDMFNTASRHRIVADVYAPSASTQLQGSLDQAYSTTAIKSLGLDPDGTAPAGLTLVSRTIPVGTKTTAGTADAATVQVWCTALAGLAGQGSTKPVTTSWFTITEKLVWDASGTSGGGDWKIASSSQKEGPAPVGGDQQVATADQIAGAVQQYGGFTYAR